jgi:hypothetical protein
MCALKVSLSTAKGKRMPGQVRLPATIRVLRLAAAMSLVIALAAIATIVNGDSPAKSRVLVAAAIGLGSLALMGMALIALPHVRRKKEQNDPRP